MRVEKKLPLVRGIFVVVMIRGVEDRRITISEVDPIGWTGLSHN